MESAALKIEKIAGVANPKTAPSVFSSRFTFTDGAVGTVVSCILIEDAPKGDAAELSKDIFEIANKRFEAEGNPIMETLEAIKQSTQDYFSARGIKAAFAHILFKGEAAYIVRGADKVRVFVFALGKSVELTFEKGSGPLAGGQIYLLATEKFIGTFGTQDLLKQDTDLEEIADGLATEISAKEDSSQIAAAFILVGEGRDAAEGVRDSSRSEKGKDEDAGESEPARAVVEAVEAKDDDRPEVKIGAGESDEENLRPVEPQTKESRFGKFAEFVKKRFGLFLTIVIKEVRRIRGGDLPAIGRLRRNIVLVVFLLILVLAVSSGFAIKSKRDRQLSNEFNGYLVSANTKYSEADAIFEFNLARAREILIDAEREVGRALEIKPKDERAQELKSKIATRLTQTESVASVKFETVVDTSENLVSLSVLGKNLIGFSQGKVFRVDIASKASEDFDIEGSVGKGFAFSDSAFGLGQDVFKVNLQTGGGEKAVEGADGFDIAVFAGNIYLLSQSQILKHVPVENGYAEASDYLVAPESFDSSSQIAIDGAVWVTRGDKILKFLRGAPEAFEISGLTAGAYNFSEIYTNADLDNLYVVDAANKALLVISKDGLYRQAYQAEEFGKLTGLVVDEAAGKMYLAVGSKILAADL